MNKRVLVFLMPFVLCLCSTMILVPLCRAPMMILGIAPESEGSPFTIGLMITGAIALVGLAITRIRLHRRAATEDTVETGSFEINENDPNIIDL